MLGSKLIAFLDALRNNQKAFTGHALFADDEIFLSELEARFQRINSLSSLSLEDLNFILAIFKRRATKADYTVNPGGYNACWLQFALDIAKSDPTFQKSYIDILMPYITNVTDPTHFIVLSSYENPKVFFRGKDGKTLHHLPSLIEQVVKKRTCLIFDGHGNKKDSQVGHLSGRIPRALAVTEICSIDDKSEAFPFVTREKKCINFSGFLRQKLMRYWSQQGELPVEWFKSLAELIALYFEVVEEREGRSKFVKAVEAKTELLCYYPAENVYYLYSQTLAAGDHRLFLDILLSWLRQDLAAIYPSVIDVAHWLLKQNKSLIIARPELDTLYQTYQVGPYFDLSALKIAVDKLHSTDPAVQHYILELSAKIQRRLNRDISLIEADLIEILGVIFGLQSLHVQDKEHIKNNEKDYLRIKPHEANAWAELAQALRGAGLIKKSYQLFLMPSLEGTVDPTTGIEILVDPITGDEMDAPLSHCVLSDDGRGLIELQNCVNYYQSHGKFYYEAIKPSNKFKRDKVTRALTKLEIDRMAFAHEKFKPFIAHAEKSSNVEKPVAKTTILALEKFINGSHFSSGLRCKFLSPEEEKMAIAAFHELKRFLEGLPKDERDRLNAELIIYKEQKKTFGLLYQEIKSIYDDIAIGEYQEEDACATKLSLLVVKLILDYMPWIRFSEAIEKSTSRHHLQALREAYCQKFLSDYSCLEDDEVVRRLQLMTVSIMSFNFRCPYFSTYHTASLWDCSHYIPPMAKKILDILQSLLVSGNVNKARLIYMEIFERVLLPAKGKQGTITWWERATGHEEVLNDWVNSVTTEAIFSAPGIWYHPGHLFERLPSLVPGNKAVSDFIKDLIHTYTQSQSSQLQEVRVNIKFQKLLQLLESETSQKVLASLAKTTSTSDVYQKKFPAMYAQYLVEQLIHSVDDKVKPSSWSLFRGQPLALERIKQKLLEPLQLSQMDCLTVMNVPIESVVDVLKKCIEDMPKELCNPQLKAYMQDALLKLCTPIKSLEAFPVSKGQPTKVLTISP